MKRIPSRSAERSLLLGLLTLGLAAGAARRGDAGDLRPAVALASVIQLSTNSMTFNAPLGGPNPPPQLLKLKNIGASPFKWVSSIAYTSGTPGWLTASPGKGHRGPRQSKTISVGVLMTTLAAGTYKATLTFDTQPDPGGANAVPVNVTLNVRSLPFIDVEPSTGLVFNAPLGSGLQPTQTLTLSNLGGQTMNNWAASVSTTTPAPPPAWLVSVTPSGVAGGGANTLAPGASVVLTVTVDATSIPVGTWAGVVTVTAANATNSPFTVPITLVVASAPVLDVNLDELDFSAPVTSPNPPSQSVTIRNDGGSTLNCTSFTIQNASTWLSVSPTSATGIAPGVTLSPGFTVSVNITGLAAGSYSDFVVINTNATTAVIGGNTFTNPPTTQFTVLITLTVTSTAVMDVEPQTLTYNAPLGGPDPAIQTVAVTNQGGSPGSPPPAGTILSWKATIQAPAPAWLSLNLSQDLVSAGQPGVAPGASDTVQVIVKVASISTAGSYTATINFDDQNGTIISVFVTLNVSAVPIIQLSQTSFIFNVPAGSGTPVSQTVTLGNAGGGPNPLVWAGSTPAPWLAVGPGSGSLAAGESTTLTITVDPSTLTAGSYVGQITITGTVTAGTVPNSPQVISVTVNATAVPQIQLTPSSLTFDVAQNGAAVQQTVTLANVGGGPDLTFQTSSGGTAWLGVTPANGTLAAGQSMLLTITATPQAGQALGTYTGLVTVGNSNASNDPQSVFVTMNIVDVPKMALSPTSLVFNLSVGGAVGSQSVTLSNTGGGATALAYSIPNPTPTTAWLGVAPLTGTVTAGSGTTLTISADPSNGGSPLPAGTYTANIEVDSSNAENQPQFISVTMNLTAQPRIGQSPTSLTFTTGVNTNPGNQTVTITNTGGSSLTWGALAAVNTPSGGTWLTLSAPTPPGTLSAGSSATFNAQVNVTSPLLGAGTYSGTITITAGGATNSPQTIPVTLNVLAGSAISVAPASLSFSTPVGTSPAAQSLTVSNTGGSALNWSASAIVSTPPSGTWLGFTGTTASPLGGLAAGSSAPSFNVTVDVTGLIPGTYSGTVRITGDASTTNSPMDVPVTLKVESQPVISLSPAALVFTVTLGVGNPTDQTVTVTNLGDLTLNWTATPSVSTPVAGTWLSLTGTTSGALTGGVSAPPFNVTVDVTGLAAGSYSGTVTVSDPNATNNPQTIGVTLIINTPAGTIVIPKAGYCGSVGFDVAFPLFLLWAFRRWRGGRRAAGALLSLFLVLVFSLSSGTAARADDETDLPRSLSQEEKTPERPTEMPAPGQEAKPEEEFFDVAGGALNVHVGVLDFSSRFKANAEFCGGLGLRVPSPYLSTLFGPERDRIGFLLDVSGSSVSRHITGITDKSGTLVFAAAGLYGSFLRTESFEAQAEVAAQYGYFGGVTRLTNGVAALVGLRGLLELSPGLWAVLEPEIAIGSGGSQVYFLNAGVDIGF